jgi:hypothetical protein
MFSVPQPAHTESSKLPIVNANDPPEVFEIFLRIIYPIHGSPTDDAESLASVLCLADNHDAKVAPDTHKESLPRICINFPPIYKHANLCVCGCDKDAEAAVRRVPFTLSTSLSSLLLYLTTVGHYHRLKRLMVAQDRRMWQIVSRHCEPIARGPRLRGGTLHG